MTDTPNETPALEGPDAPLDEVEASRAPLMEHLVELRRRLIISFASLAIGFVLCFFVSTQIYNILLVPYERAAGAVLSEHCAELSEHFRVRVPWPFELCCPRRSAHQFTSLANKTPDV